jgi:alpha-glucan phosphorylase-like protein
LETHPEAIEALSDRGSWAFRVQRRQHGADSQADQIAQQVVDPNVLTLGFARRFTAYKLPNLLLHDPERLIRILTHQERPVRLIVAGKAHPQDDEGKRLVQHFAWFANQPAVRHRVIFLEDYEMALAQYLVRGIDVWLNTPQAVGGLWDERHERAGQWWAQLLRFMPHPSRRGQRRDRQARSERPQEDGPA